MKKNLVSKLVMAMTGVVAACTLMGCTVSSTQTYTESHTDADGNTTTTTTTTVRDNNGTTTTTNTTNSAEDADVEETEEAQSITAELSITNSSDVDFQAIYFTSSNSDNWGDDVLGDDAPLRVDEMITFFEFEYSEDDLYWDLGAEIEEGDGYEFRDLDLSLAQDPEHINLVIVCDEEDGGYIVSVE